jgi:hypothetical protein
MRLLSGLLAMLAVASGASPGPELRGVDGKAQYPFQVSGKAQVLLFVMTDCPISNFYAPEIQRICNEYGPKGAGCSLVYEDLTVDAQRVGKHLAEYGYRNVGALLDPDRKAAHRAGATVTPEAVVLDATGEVRYRGRIDNFYAALGKPRRRATTHELQDAVEAVLAGKPVAVPEAKALGCYIAPPDVLKDAVK